MKRWLWWRMRGLSTNCAPNSPFEGGKGDVELAPEATGRARDIPLTPFKGGIRMVKALTMSCLQDESLQ
jgi:hypothetical protein